MATIVDVPNAPCRSDRAVCTRAELTERAKQVKTVKSEAFTFASSDGAETAQFNAMPLVSLLWRLHMEQKGRDTDVL